MSSAARSLFTGCSVLDIKESIYVHALCLELDSLGLAFEREKRLTVTYKGREIPGQRLDLIVEGVLIVE